MTSLFVSDEEAAYQIATTSIALTKARWASQEDVLDDPVAWVERRLHHTPWDREAEIIRSVFENRRTTVRSGQGLGKTWTAADIILAFLNAYADAVVVSTAPTWRQVNSILWGYIRTAHSRSGLPGHCLRTELRIAEDHYALGFATKEPERFQGFHSQNLLVVVDEASGLEPNVEPAIEGVMASGNAHLLMIGNPTKRSGMFHESHTSKRHLYNAIHISTFDSPNFTSPGSYPALVSPEWVEERREDWGEDHPLYQIRVLGNFPDQDEYGLVSLVWLENAKAEVFYDEWPTIAALDVARGGSDENCLYVRRGRQVMRCIAWHAPNTMTTIARVQDELAPFRDQLKQLRVDSVGLGGGVADRLRELEYPVRDIEAGAASARPDDYINIRAEMFWNVRGLLENGLVGGLTDEKTQAQLTTIEWEIQSDKKIKIVSKEIMKSKGVTSPDRADAFAMCFLPYSTAHGGEQVVAASRWHRQGLVQAGDEQPDDDQDPELGLVTASRWRRNGH